MSVQVSRREVLKAAAATALVAIIPAAKAETQQKRRWAMHPNGEYIVWAYRMLDTLVGNFHRKGGILGRPSTTSYNNYVYDAGTSGFGEPVRWGPPIDRHGRGQHYNGHRGGR